MSSAPHALASYLPRLLIDRLACDPPLTGPESRRTMGAVLLSDIQGFTGLVESFAVRGRAGLEELTSLLNAYFTDLVCVVEAHGGDVLYIAGDAFLCYWPATRHEDLPEAVLRAVQAGREVQRILHDRPAGDDRRFATRIGVGVGDLIVAYVGGVAGRWELIASGGALADVVSAETRAAPGRVVASPAAWSHVAAYCVGRVGADSAVEVTTVLQALDPVPLPPRQAPSGEDTWLHPFVPPAVRDRLVAADAEWLAETRGVTVLMADLPGLTGADAGELERTHVCVRGFQEIVERFEGTVKVDLDDKGILLLAVFGLPPRAHEDDSMRAVLAAQAVGQLLSDADCPRGVGVATGRAFCGTFGSNVRRDYMVRGDAINLAARLMRATARGAICDVATVRATRDRLAFEALPPVAIHGKGEPITVFRPQGRTTPHGRTTPPGITHDAVIGRVQELSALAERLDVALGGGHAGVTIIEADAGLGKSRLVSEVARQASSSGVRVLTAAADAIERSTPYFAWRPVLTALFEVGPDDDAQIARERVLSRAADYPSVERLFPLLSSMLPVQIPDNPLTAEMTGDVRADNTKLLLRQFLQRAAAEAPTLLVVEDAHWLDSGSWGLLIDAVQSVRPLFIVVATRPFGEPAPPDYVRLTQAPGAQRLVLDALSSDETLALVRQRLGVHEVPVSLVRFVQERVAGHPFFCEEVLRSMLESGVIRVNDGLCEVGDLGALDLPTTVEGVIVSRLDRLTPSEQLCLKIASVIGRVFRARMVRDTHPIDSERPHVAEHLRTLTAVDLTLLDAPEPDLAYLFKHVITRDVAYEAMPFAQRQPLHRAVATWYEHSYAGDLAPHYALLAYHWARAANPTKTVDYLEKAGEQALHAGAFREAALFLSQANELVEHGEVVVGNARRALWEKGLGRAHYYLGNLHVSRVHNERALAWIHRAVPPGNAGAMAGALAGIGLQIAHRLFPRRYIGRRGANKALLDEAVECYKILGQAYYLEAEPPLKLMYLTVTGLNIGEEAGSSAELARIMINASMLAYLVGLPGQAEWYADRAIAMAGREGQYGAAAYVWHIRALSLAQRAAWAEAKEANAKARALTQELGDVGLEGEGWTMRTTLALCEGDFAFAPTGWTRQRELAERSGNGQLRCWALLDETDTWLGLGDIVNASRALEAALAIPTATTDVGTALDKARSTAVTRLRQGRDAEAARAADTVFDALKRQPPTGYQWADDFAEVVEIYLVLLRQGGEYTDAHRVSLERRAHDGCRLVMRFSRIYRNVYPRAWLLRGLLLRYRGKHDDAQRALSKAAAIGLEMQMPFERARAQLELARLLDGSARHEAARESRETFARLGAEHYMGILDALACEP